MKQRFESLLLASAAAVVFSIGMPADGLAQAQNSERAAPGRGPVTVLDPVTIVGSREAVRDVPGSAAVLEAEDIREKDFTDVNRVLRGVPGVNVREEDGYGNFPNISLRGVTTVRSSKVTLMEDGILTAPAPYSSPAAYYSPAVGRMSGLEVIKGSSQIKFGPQITGGALNYLSTPIPDERTTYLKGYYGSHNEVFGHVYYGNTLQTDSGRFGYLIEGHLHRTDGFKTIDAAPGVDRDDTGFLRVEPMIKLSWEPDTAMFQRFEIKYGYTHFEADETYLGLREGDIRANPFRRYAATRFDHIDTEHHRSYVRHLISPTDALQIATTAYFNHFHRSWYKLNDVRNAGDPTWRNLSETLAGAHGPANAMGVLLGTTPGQLRYRNNNRTYYLYGIQQDYRFEFDTGPLSHELEGGIRYHYDQEKRFQNDVVYTQDATGRFASSVAGAPGSQENRVGESRALALYLQDRVRYGQWSFVPGIRYESIWHRDANSLTSSTLSGRMGAVAGGLGVQYDLSGDWSLFAGVFRGFSVPDPGGHLRNNLKTEHSIAFETGARYDNRRGLGAEAIFFHTRFRNLIVPSNAGGGGTLATENAGNVNVNGLELLTRYDPGVAGDWAVKTPLSLAFTYTDARFSGGAGSIGAGGSEVESIFSGARSGNRVPYIPEYQVTAGAGIAYNRVGVYLTGTYVPWTFATGSNTSSPVRPDGTPDARFGKTDSYFVLDLTARVQVNESLKVFAGIKNLLDREYVVSRIPHGPRPGAPRLVHAGLELTF